LQISERVLLHLTAFIFAEFLQPQSHQKNSHTAKNGMAVFAYEEKDTAVDTIVSTAVSVMVD